MKQEFVFVIDGPKGPALQEAAEKNRSCRRCASEHQRSLSADVAIHLPDRSAPHVFLFPVLLVCLTCGFAEFLISGMELPLIVERLAASGKSDNAEAA